jgi:hypothetical protein
MSSEENNKIDLMEGIKTAKLLSGDDPLEFSWPDGFLSAARSLQFLPDDATRIQIMSGMAHLIQGLYAPLSLQWRPDLWP